MNYGFIYFFSIEIMNINHGDKAKNEELNPDQKNIS